MGQPMTPETHPRFQETRDAIAAQRAPLDAVLREIGEQVVMAKETVTQLSTEAQNARQQYLSADSWETRAPAKETFTEIEERLFDAQVAHIARQLDWRDAELARCAQMKPILEEKLQAVSDAMLPLLAEQSAYQKELANHLSRMRTALQEKGRLNTQKDTLENEHLAKLQRQLA